MKGIEKNELILLNEELKKWNKIEGCLQRESQIKMEKEKENYENSKKQIRLSKNITQDLISQRNNAMQKFLFSFFPYSFTKSKNKNKK